MPTDTLIRSGTLVPGIDPAAFGLPAGTALRCERPEERVRPFVSAYFVMDSESDYQGPGTEWMLPTWAQIWVVFAREAISVSIGRRRYAKLPPVVLYGVTSRAMPVTAHGGISIGIELTPLGWARLIRGSAERLRDQLIPLDQAIDPSIVTELARTLLHLGFFKGIKPALDAFFAAQLRSPHRDERSIELLMRTLNDERASTVADVCNFSGLGERAAGRVARQHMGFPIKTLLMRTRFLRALMPFLDGQTTGQIPAGYHDQSHFLRDARRYLGMTPTQFEAQRSVYAEAVRRARRLVIGAPVASLDNV